MADWHELSRLVVEDAIARGRTCTGEHGIGLGKVRALELPGKVVASENPLLA